MKKRVALLILILLFSTGSTGCTASQSFTVAYRWTREFMGFPIEEPPEEPKPEAPRYVGYGRCVFCHAANYYVVKLTTRHDKAFETLIGRKEEKNEECLPCHTVGYDKKKDDGGYDDSHERRELEGIQCESCHGPASNHVRGIRRLVRTLSADVCKCHTGSHHPTIDEWKRSKHANSLADLKKNSKAEDKCLKCMSTEGVVGTKTSLQKAVYSVTCVACHNPHVNTNSYQLRMEPQELCPSCHTAEEPKVGAPVHHPQKEMMATTGGIDGVVPVRGHNTEVKGRYCLKCHYYTRSFKSEAEPAITGHDFKAYTENCSPCHSDAADRKARTQAAIKSALDRLKSQLDSIDGAKLDPAKKRLYDEAKFNYEFVANDGSLGVHNKVYAESLIRAAQERLGQVQK